MKNQFVWVSALALAVTATSQIETHAAYTNSDGVIITNGVVIITTRTAIDAFWRQQSSSTLWDADDAKGPGDFSPGDAAMGELLQDYGYTTRMLPERVLWGTTTDWIGNPSVPQNYYTGYGGPSSPSGNILWSAMLVIVSGSGSSADMPPPNTNRIPIIMGEHSCLGDNVLGSHSQLYMYRNKTSANLTSPSANGLYMKVMAPDHPIMQGIPLDAQGRVKIFREAYPEENAHTAFGSGQSGSPKSNYEISWTAVDISEGKSVAAPGVNVIGVLDSNPSQAVFAVVEAGTQIWDTSNDPSHNWQAAYPGVNKAPARLVHFFVNEGGSGNTRRSFNALTVWGRIIFMRTCKWAMSETLEPYKSFRILDVSSVGAQKIKLSWQGSGVNNYRIDGTTDFVNWQPVVADIAGGTNLIVARTLDISAGPQAVFMRVAALP